MTFTEEQAYEVPKNWIWVKSEFVAKWGSGGTPSRKKMNITMEAYLG